MSPAMSTVDQLLTEIAAFCDDFAIPESTFGRRVMNDSKFVERIRQGGGLTVANLDRIRSYMAEQRGDTTTKSKGARAPRVPASKRAGRKPASRGSPRAAA